MGYVKLLVMLPLVSVFIVFLLQNNELVSLWPISHSHYFPSVESISLSVIYFVLFCLGYMFGRISAWSAYAPLRAMLKKQKKENKILSKEQVKLSNEHEKLNNQILSLKEEADKTEKRHGFSLNKKIKGWFSKPSSEDR